MELIPSYLKSGRSKGQYSMPPTVILDKVGLYSLAASTVIVIGLLVYGRKKFTIRGAISYSLLFVGISASSVILFQVSPTASNLSIPPLWTLLFEGVSSSVYYGFFGRHKVIPVGVLECYAIGTFSIFAGDAFRTYLLPLSLPIVHWGGAGYGDLLFQFGLYMAGIFLAISAGLAKKNELLQKLFGARIGERLRRSTEKKGNVMYMPCHRRS